MARRLWSRTCARPHPIWARMSFSGSRWSTWGVRIAFPRDGVIHAPWLAPVLEAALVALLVTGVIILAVPPQIIYRMRRPTWSDDAQPPNGGLLGRSSTPSRATSRGPGGVRVIASAARVAFRREHACDHRDWRRPRSPASRSVDDRGGSGVVVAVDGQSVHHEHVEDEDGGRPERIRGEREHRVDRA